MFLKSAGTSTWLTAIVFLLAGAAVILTNDRYGFAIDEASYLWVAEEERLWFDELPQLGLWKSLSEEQVKRHWHFLEPPAGRQAQSHSNFNLPLSQHLLNVSWLLAHRFTHELTAYRLANMVLFALTAACFFRWLWRTHDLATAIVGVCFLIGSPRIFGHAHLAATETTLGCFWLLTLLTLCTGEEEPRCRPFPFALLLSLTMSVKLTGWFLAPAAATWLLWFRPQGYAKALLWSCLLCPCTIVLLTPPLWHHPVSGVLEYLQATSSDPWKIPSYFLGSGYKGNMPAWSAFFLIGVTVPVAPLLLAMFDIFDWPRRRQVMLFLLPTASLIAVRVAGAMPQHDGERQFLPVYYCLAALAALGWSRVKGSLTSRIAWPRLAATVTTILAAAAVSEPVWETVQYSGHGLSYYNRLIGGLPGAANAGMEISYWWEGISHDEWRYFLADVPPGSTLFVHPNHPGLEYLKRWGVWRDDLKSGAPEDADYFLLYAKRSAYVVENGAGQLVPTDLMQMMEHSPAPKEVRFKNVRLAALIPRR